MKTPIRIVVVSNFGASENISGTTEVLPGKIDDLVKKMNPKIRLASDIIMDITSMADFSLEGLKGQLGESSCSADDLTNVLHDKQFQATEASWRGLDYLVQQLPEENVCLEVLNSSYDEVRRRVYDCVMKPEYEGQTEIPATIILADYDFEHKGESFDAFVDLAKMGEAIKAPVVAQTDAGFFGLKHLLHLPTIKDPLERIATQEYAPYHAFRETDTSFWASLMLNRFLLRAPYKEDDYVEPASAAKPEQYLWGRGIWILGANIIQSFSSKGHLVGISGLGTGGEQVNMPFRELPLSRDEKIQTPLDASLPQDIVESLPYFGLSLLSQIPNEMGGQNQPGMIYLHLAANMRHIPDSEEKQFGVLTVHTSLAYSLMLGRISNLALKYTQAISNKDKDKAAGELKEHLLNDMWKKEDEEIVVTATDNAFHIEYNPYLVIHTRRFEIVLDIPN